MIIQSSSRCLDGRAPGRLCSAMLAGRAQEEQGQAGGDPHLLPKEGKVLSAVAWKDTYPLKSFSKVFRFLPDATLNPKP